MDTLHVRSMESKPTFSCNVVYEVGYRCSENRISQCVRAVMEHERVYGAVTVVFVSKERMIQMNTQFRGIKAVTDVLSFAEREDGIYLGEIVLCPEAFHFSKEHNEEWEVLHLVTHGTFHLTGRHHEHSDGAYDAIHKEEVAIINNVIATNAL